MEQRRWCRRSAWGGGAAIAVGIVLFALFSDAGGACTANVVVLSDGVVGPHGCAASSIASHAGIGLMVLGAALLVVACLLAILGRTPQPEAPGPRSAAGTVGGDRRTGGDRRASAALPVAQGGTNGSNNGNATNGSAGKGREPEPLTLPPGWYGNPGNRNGAVQWWDGHRLVDRPPPTERGG